MIRVFRSFPLTHALFSLADGPAQPVDLPHCWDPRLAIEGTYRFELDDLGLSRGDIDRFDGLRPY